jgi:hypothetical protein
MEKRIFRITPTNRCHVAEQVSNLPEGYVIKTGPPTRSLEANAALWAMLTDVSKQVVWHGRKLDAESWKHIFSSSLRKQDVVPNLDGTGFVVMGVSTSSMSKREMSDLLELIQAFGAQNNVKFNQN